MYKEIAKSYQDIFPKVYIKNDTITDKLLNKETQEISIPFGEFVVKTVTFIVTEGCQLRCKYCYEHNKNSHAKMTKETAKKAVDCLFDSYKNNSEYINKDNAKAIVLDFIGGEPLLEIDLLEYIVEYFRERAIKENHPWLFNHMISISTNGIAYLDAKVQRFIKNNHERISIGITIDGNRELHDSCRVFPDGKGSYDIVEKSIEQQIKDYYNVYTKLTLSPENITYLFDALVNLYNLGLKGVYANCVFEKGWEIPHAKILYEQMKKFADYMIDNGIYKDFFCTLFDDTIGKPEDESRNLNWCGGTGVMLAFGSDGNIFPCLRYSPVSLKDKEPIIIGNIESGIESTEKEKETVSMLKAITRRSQSTDECFYCPISSGCAWCSAYNYEVFGTVNKRATFICIMHKARVLANVYYWNKLYKVLGINNKFECNVPKEWAIDIIGEQEFEELIHMYL